MHEFALTKNIVRIVEQTARDNGAKRVICAHLVIGENTSIIPESVQMYYDAIAKDTVAQGARLIVRTIKPQMLCPVCKTHFVRPRFSFECPLCGTLGNPTEIGNEFYLENIEIET